VVLKRGGARFHVLIRQSHGQQHIYSLLELLILLTAALWSSEVLTLSLEECVSISLVQGLFLHTEVADTTVP
jgi:hypothetical protein